MAGETILPLTPKCTKQPLTLFFSIQLSVLINPSFRRPSWLHKRILPHRLALGNGDEEQNTADPRRAIDFLPAGERYSDNPVVEASDSEAEETAQVPRRSIGQVADMIPTGASSGGEQPRGGHVENEWTNA